MVLVLCLNDSTRTFSFMSAMMADPLFTENLPSERSKTNCAASCSKFIATVKSMSCGSEPDDWLSSIKKLGDVSSLYSVRLTESGADYHQVRTVQSLESTKAFLVIRIDIIISPRKYYGAIKSVPLGKNFAEHRTRLLRTVFFVTSHNDYVLAFAWARFAF